MFDFVVPLMKAVGFGMPVPLGEAADGDVAADEDTLGGFMLLPVLVAFGACN